MCLDELRIFQQVKKKTMKKNNIAYTSSIQRKLYFKQCYFLESV